MRYVLAGLLIWLSVAPALAHKPSDSYLSIEIRQRVV